MKPLSGLKRALSRRFLGANNQSWQPQRSDYESFWLYSAALMSTENPPTFEEFRQLWDQEYEGKPGCVDRTEEQKQAVSRDDYKSAVFKAKNPLQLDTYRSLLEEDIAEGYTTSRDAEYQMCLVSGCTGEHLEILKDLGVLEVYNVDHPDCCGTGLSALQLAVSNANPAAVRKLIEWGADVHKRYRIRDALTREEREVSILDSVDACSRRSDKENKIREVLEALEGAGLNTNGVFLEAMSLH